MKNIVLAVALCAAVSLDGMHATRRVCKEIPQAIPAALKKITRSLKKEAEARDRVVRAIDVIGGRKIFDVNAPEVKNLRVRLLPALMVASAETGAALSGGIVRINSQYYDSAIKPEEYIVEMAPVAFGAGVKTVNWYCYDRDYLAYKKLLVEISKNPDLLKIMKLK